MSTLSTALAAAVAELSPRRTADFEPARPAPGAAAPDRPTAAPDQPTVEIDCPARLEDRVGRPRRGYEPIGPSSGSRP